MEIAMNSFHFHAYDEHFYRQNDIYQALAFMTQKISVRLKKNTQNFALFVGINIA